ncbi:MAG: hypothetical protein R3D58_00025 [Saprospiraceae bacterium]|nr:hypothetical protein [Lewinellaceae bacterium]
MDLQELTEIWNNFDKNIDNKTKLNKDLLKEVSIQKIKDNLHEINWESIIEIVFNIPFLYFLLSCLPNQLTSIKFALPAFILITFSIFSLVFCGYKLYLFYSIDSRQSVLQTQKTIERLNYLQSLEINILYVIIPAFSFAFLIFIAKCFFNFDLYSLGTWLISYTIGSLIIAVIIVFFLKQFPDKKLQKSMAFLREIKEIES